MQYLVWNRIEIWSIQYLFIQSILISSKNRGISALQDYLNAL